MHKNCFLKDMISITCVRSTDAFIFLLNFIDILISKFLVLRFLTLQHTEEYVQLMHVYFLQITRASEKNYFILMSKISCKLKMNEVIRTVHQEANVFFCIKIYPVIFIIKNTNTKKYFQSHFLRCLSFDIIRYLQNLFLTASLQILLQILLFKQIVFRQIMIISFTNFPCSS